MDHDDPPQSTGDTATVSEDPRPTSDTASAMAEVNLSPPGRLDYATVVIVEDLTFLLSNLLGEDEAMAEGRAYLELQELLALPSDLILVSNEVGMGLVPPYPLGRLFRDALGRLNQAAAAGCGEVYLLVAGLPLQLK